MRKRPLFLASITAFALSAQASSSNTEIEFMHFWKSPGEQAALEVLLEKAQQKGLALHSTCVENANALRERVIERYSIGLPPTSFQWHAGKQLKTLFQLGLVQNLSQLSNVDKHLAQLSPVVKEHTMLDGQLIAVPINIHGDNWAWYNAAIYRELSLSLPKSWDEFLVQAPAIQKAGYAPLVVGKTPWEQRMLFITIILAEGGPELYKAITKQTPYSAEILPSLKRSIEIFLALKPFSETLESKSWIEATEAIIEKRAALNIMGDWAKAELLKNKLEAGLDFHCAMAPGNEKTYLVVIDTIAFSATKTRDIQSGQKDLIDTIFDKKYQIEFSKLKGSLPAVHGGKIEDLDACGQYGFNIFRRPENQLANPSLLMDTGDYLDLENIIHEIWIRNWNSQQALDYLTHHLYLHGRK